MKLIWKKMAVSLIAILIISLNGSIVGKFGSNAQAKYLTGLSTENYRYRLELHPRASFFSPESNYILYLPLIFKQSPGLQTQVIVFYPTGSSEPPRNGYCWTSSLDILRPDAWRCMDTNQYIFDPCISPLNETGYVVCDAYPLGGRDGFKLYLTQPLPIPVPIDPGLEKSFAWVMELFDGTTCSLIQASTWPTCLPRYSCSDGLEIKDYPNPGYLWTAERGQFSDVSCSVTQPVISDIKTVWK